MAGNKTPANGYCARPQIPSPNWGRAGWGQNQQQGFPGVGGQPVLHVRAGAVANLVRVIDQEALDLGVRPQTVDDFRQRDGFRAGRGALGQ